MRTFAEILVVLVIALVLGGGVSWYSIQNNRGFGALTIGQWTAWPLAGSVDADPYTKAKVAAEGEVPLGAAEGLAFHARLDDGGNPLQKNCQYRISGQTPLARFWTLSPHDLDGNALGSGDDSRIISYGLVRNPEGDFTINAGPELASGNWLPVMGTGNYAIILTLYDTPITSTRGIVDPKMPTIERLRCFT